MKKGFSLIEILVVIALFAVLSIIATQSLTLTIRGMKKTDNTTKVRESLDFAMGVISRNLRNADSLTTICPNSDTSRIDYMDQNGLTASFSCQNIGVNGYVASSSARLTNDSIVISSCSFQCGAGSNNVPPYVVINLTGKNAGVTNAESGSYDVSTRVLLRTY
ncbi:MAG: prepilin-type N-terminal cleavage/methylation domain-containing protein [Candidatus Woesebacteria bacterium]|nr:MAG: prepilin-type N-terminal cleavage/methylation domain-containing protein [Candidatus Woesebacteria bacterium]